MKKVEEFLKWAEESGWEVKRHNALDLGVSNEIFSRYSMIPDEFLEFLKLVDTCVTADEKSWFLCVNDYNGAGDSAFSWNEFEKMSLEVAEDDNEWKLEITKFWDKYLPVTLSVRHGYAYYALDVGSDFGSVVYGCEPEFEDAYKVASSFYEFLDKITKKAIEL